LKCHYKAEVSSQIFYLPTAPFSEMALIHLIFKKRRSFMKMVKNKKSAGNLIESGIENRSGAEGRSNFNPMGGFGT